MDAREDRTMTAKEISHEEAKGGLEDFGTRMARHNRRLEAVAVAAICLLALLVAGVCVRAAVLHWMAGDIENAVAMVICVGITAVV